MSGHDLLAAGAGLPGADLGMLLEDVRRHRISEGHDDARDDEQQRPKKHLQIHQEHAQHLVQIVGRGDLEHVVQDVLLPALVEETHGVVVTDDERIHDEDHQQETGSAEPEGHPGVGLDVGKRLSGRAEQGDDGEHQRRDHGCRPVAAQAVQRSIFVLLIRSHDGKWLSFVQR